MGSDCVLVMFLGGVFIYWFYGLFGGVWLRFLGGHFGRFSGCGPVLASFLSVGKLAMVVVRVQGAPPSKGFKSAGTLFSIRACGIHDAHLVLFAFPCRLRHWKGWKICRVDPL